MNSRALVILISTLFASCVARTVVPDLRYSLLVTQNDARQAERPLGSEETERNQWTARAEGIGFDARIVPGRIELDVENRGTGDLNLAICDSAFQEWNSAPQALYVGPAPGSSRVREQIRPKSTSRVVVWPTKDAPPEFPDASPVHSEKVGATEAEVMASIEHDVGRGFDVVLATDGSHGERKFRFRFVVTELGARVWRP